MLKILPRRYFARLMAFVLTAYCLLTTSTGFAQRPICAEVASGTDANLFPNCEYAGADREIPTNVDRQNCPGRTAEAAVGPALADGGRRLSKCRKRARRRIERSD